MRVTHLMAMDRSPVSAAAPEAGAQKERLDPEFIKLAVILLAGVVMVGFDTTIVNVAINDIAQGLHTTVSTAQWTISGDLLARGMVVPVAAWASGRFGAMQVWTGALAPRRVRTINNPGCPGRAAARRAGTGDGPPGWRCCAAAVPARSAGFCRAGSSGPAEPGTGSFPGQPARLPRHRPPRRRPIASFV
jgi:hypothetical protein